jgi:mRNA-degrading endonuclease RelE of RelBE toxin-antitoxin system
LAWQIKFIPKIEKQLRKIPAQDVQKIFDFLKKQVAKNPIIVLIVKVGHRKDVYR